MNNTNHNLPFNVPDYARELKHGTTTAAISFDGGVAVATDRRASMGYMVASPRVKKMYALDNKSMLTIAGLPSDALYLLKIMKAEMSLWELNRGRPMTVKVSANLLSTIMYQQFRSYMPYFVQIMLVGVDATGPHIFNFDASGSVSEDPFSSTGSGSPFAYGALEALYKDNMSQEEAMTALAKALRSAVVKDIASGDGIDIATITPKDGVVFYDDEELKRLLGKSYPFP
ncbi:MAG: proteasome subunit beta [Candidatus Heimdallarchaeota archaeon]|nr:proteasome subunit beta [Candidatus Heimdallarchaeota archaeon]MDH5644648.1 proteasome subunit beta [Candidatus Heimdallarchaeota archaeon]